MTLWYVFFLFLLVLSNPGNGIEHLVLWSLVHSDVSFISIMSHLELRSITKVRLFTKAVRKVDFWIQLERIYNIIASTDYHTPMLWIVGRDEFELEFSGSSEPELWRFRAKPSRAELGHFNFRAETELNFF